MERYLRTRDEKKSRYSDKLRTLARRRQRTTQSEKEKEHEKQFRILQDNVTMQGADFNSYFPSFGKAFDKCNGELFHLAKDISIFIWRFKNDPSLTNIAVSAFEFLEKRGKGTEVYKGYLTKFFDYIKKCKIFETFNDIMSDDDNNSPTGDLPIDSDNDNYFIDASAIESDDDNFSPQGEDFLESCDKARDLMDCWPKLKKSALWRKLRLVILYVTSLGLWDRIHDKQESLIVKIENEQYSNKGLYSIDATYAILDMIVFMAERGYQCCKTGNLDAIYHSGASYEAWYTESLEMIAKSRYLKNPEAHHIDIHEYIAKIKDMIAKGKCIYKYAIDLDKMSRNTVAKTINQLEVILSDDINRVSAQKTRRAPLAICLAGHTSVAKSTCTDMLHVLYSTFRGKDSTSASKYVRNVTEIHWNGYTSDKHTIIFDDVAFENPAMMKEVSPSVSEMLNILNNTPHTFNMAALEEKGTTPCLAEFVVATTNSPHLHATTYFACPVALLRRFAYYIHITPKPEYLQDDNIMIDPSKLPRITKTCLPDYWTYKVYTFKPVDAKHTNPAKKYHTTPCRVLVHEFDGLDEFNPWFKSVVEKHNEIQDRVLCGNDDMQYVELCDVCVLPSDQCSCTRTRTESIKNIAIEKLDNWVNPDPLPKHYCNECNEYMPNCVCSAKDSQQFCCLRCGKYTPDCHCFFLGVNGEMQGIDNPYFNGDDMQDLCNPSMDDCSVQGCEILEDCSMQGKNRHVRSMWDTFCYVIIAYIFTQITIFSAVYIEKYISMFVTRFEQYMMNLFMRRTINQVKWEVRRWIERKKNRLNETLFVFGEFVRNHKIGTLLILGVICGAVACIAAYKYIYNYTTPTYDIACHRHPAVKELKPDEVAMFTKHKAYRSYIIMLYAIAIEDHVTLRSKMDIYPFTESFNVSSLQGNVIKSFKDIGTAPVTNQEVESAWIKPHIPITSFETTRHTLSMKNSSKIEFEEYLFKNCVTLKWKSKQEDGIHNMHSMAFGLGGQLYICCNHTVPQTSESLEVIIAEPSAVTRNRKTTISPVDVRRFVDLDICIIKLRCMENLKSRLNLFPSKHFNSYIGPAHYVGRSKDGTKYMNNVHGVRYVENFINKHTNCVENIWYGIPTDYTIKGQCGAILYAMTTQGPVILGIHQLGNTIPTGPKESGAISITREFLDSVLINDEQSRMIEPCAPLFDTPTTQSCLVGDVHHKSPVYFLEKDSQMMVHSGIQGFRSTPKSKVSRTIVCDHLIQKGYPLTVGAPVFHPWKPWRRALLEMGNAENTMNNEILTICKDNMVDRWVNNIDETWKESLQVYDNFSVINGVPGLKFVDKINRNTSAGSPWRKSKKYLMEILPPQGEVQVPIAFDQEIMDRVNQRLDNYANGYQSHPIFTASLKDKALPFAKIEINKIRVFLGSPIDFTIVTRKLLMSFIRVVQMNPFIFESSPGIDAHSYVWEQLYEYLIANGKDRMVFGDYKDYDITMKANVILFAFEAIVDFHRRCGCTKEHCDMIYALGYDIAFALIDFNGTFITLFGKNPSGQALTVIINGIVNCLYVRYCYFELNPISKDFIYEHHDVDVNGFTETMTRRRYSTDPLCDFDKNIRLTTYGDDHGIGVAKDIDWFNHTAMRDILAKHKITYTMAEKTRESVPYIHISECDFLKRKFRFDEHIGHIMAPLELNSIIQALMIGNSESLSDEERVVFLCNQQLSEFFQHGKETFDYWRNLMEEIKEKFNLHPYFELHPMPTWDLLVEKYKNKLPQSLQGCHSHCLCNKLDCDLAQLSNNLRLCRICNHCRDDDDEMLCKWCEISDRCTLCGEFYRPFYDIQPSNRFVLICPVCDFQHETTLRRATKNSPLNQNLPRSADRYENNSSNLNMTAADGDVHGPGSISLFKEA
jgi:hypothetical protein